MEPPKTFKKLPKVMNRKYKKYLHKKRAKNQNLFNIAVDRFLDKNQVSIPEEDIDNIKEEFESIIKDDEESDSQNDSENLSNYSFDSVKEGKGKHIFTHSIIFVITYL